MAILESNHQLMQSNMALLQQQLYVIFRDGDLAQALGMGRWVGATSLGGIAGLGRPWVVIPQGTHLGPDPYPSNELGGHNRRTNSIL